MTKKTTTPALRELFPSMRKFHLINTHNTRRYTCPVAAPLVTSPGLRYHSTFHVETWPLHADVVHPVKYLHT